MAIKALNKKLVLMNKELSTLECKALFVAENRTTHCTLGDLYNWRRNKNELVKEIQETVVKALSECYDGLHLLDELFNSELDSRYKQVFDSVYHPFDPSQIQNVEGGGEAVEEAEVAVKTLSESFIRKRQLTRTILKGRALIGEIKQDVEITERITLVEFLKDEEIARYFPFEWSGMNELRLRTVETAILVSKLMAQLMLYLAASDRLFNFLKSKIQSIADIKTTNCVMAQGFLILISLAEEELWKSKAKEFMFPVSVNEEELFETLISSFYDSVMDLDSIYSFTNVPVKRSLVNGARLKLEGILGFVLYRMQGIRLKIKKQKCEYWTEMKKIIIPAVWKNYDVLPRKEEVVREANAQTMKMVSEIEEGIGTSGTKKDEQVSGSSSGKKDEGEIDVAGSDVAEHGSDLEEEGDDDKKEDKEEADSRNNKGKQIVEESGEHRSDIAEHGSFSSDLADVSLGNLIFGQF